MAPAVADLRIDLPMPQLAEFCRKWRITELSVFGSVLRDDFGPESDADFLVEFAPGARYTLFDLVDMEDELRGTIGREVDLIEKRAIEDSDNFLRRRHILGSARVIHRGG